MRIRALTTISGCALTGCAALVLALPGAADATLTEVGYIAKTEPTTVPSCTAGPIGSVGKAMEEEKKKTIEEEKKRAKEAEKKRIESEERKKAAGKKKGTAKTSRVRRSRHADALLSGGTSALTPSLATLPPLARSAEASTEATETKGATTTEAPCLAVSRTTGFQTKVGTIENPLVIPENGRIVAWTIDLGRPTSTQIKFFDENEGGVAEASIATLMPVKKKKAIYYKLLSQSELIKLEPYFGLNVQFALPQSIKVKAGQVVALTVPTWAPALALGFEKTTGWRASRPTKSCSVTNTETAQTELKSNAEYACQYLTARLAYSATLIATP
ncbi:MAG TPA: hypothetical protein VGF95_01835 [Solirubrobacteraceae bacterium]|jgi:hypothetical protein